MERHFVEKMEEYYTKFVELQGKLKKSEAQRFALEKKFNEMLQTAQEEKQAHYRKLRAQYKRFVEEDRKRQERNERLVKSLERIETRLTTLSAKTERVNMLRKQYHNFLLRVSSGKPTLNEEGAGSMCKVPEPVTSTHAYDTCPRQSNEEKLEFLDKYLQSLSNQRSTDLLNQKRHARDKLSLGMRQEDISTCEDNHATAIADDIMNSIYSRYYNKTDLKLKKTVDELHKFKSDSDHAGERNTKSDTEHLTITTEELHWKIPSMVYEEARMHMTVLEPCEISADQQDLQETEQQTSGKYASTNEHITPALDGQLPSLEPHKSQEASLENLYTKEGEETMSTERSKKTYETKPDTEDSNGCGLGEANASSKQEEIELATQQLTIQNESIPEYNINELEPTQSNDCSDEQQESIHELENYLPKLEKHSNNNATPEESLEATSDEETKNEREPLNEIDNTVPLIVSKLEQHLNNNATPEEPIEHETNNQQESFNETHNTVPLMVSELEPHPNNNPTPEVPLEAKIEDAKDEKNEPEKHESIPPQIENENSAPVNDSNQMPQDSKDYSLCQTNEQYDSGGHSQTIYTNEPNEQFGYDPNYAQYDDNGHLIQYQQDDQTVYGEYADPLIYNEQGQIVQVEYDEQGQMVPQYDENGQLIRLYDQNGQPYYDYDGHYENQEDENMDQHFKEHESHDNSDEKVDNAIEDNVSQKEDDNIQNESQKSNQDLKKQEDNNFGGIEDAVEEKKEMANVMDILDTDTESSKQNVSKVSNDSEFDFS